MKKDVFLTPPLYLPVLFTFRVTVVIAVGVSIAIGMAVCPIVTTLLIAASIPIVVGIVGA